VGKLAALYMRQVVLSRQHQLSHKAQSILITKLSLHDSDINSVQSYAIARWSRFCLAQACAEPLSQMLPACSSSAKDAKALENMCTHPATQAGKTVHVFTQVLLYYCLLVNTLQAQRFKERRKARNERRKAAKAEVQEAGRRKLEANQMKRQRRRTARSAQDPHGYVCDGCRMPCPKGYCVQNRNLARLHKAAPAQANATRTDTHDAGDAQHQEITDTIGGPAR
jgi:hypothetical protein